VTLYASGDSQTSARLVPCCEKALRLDPHCQDPLAWHVMEMETVARDSDAFDVIHYHLDYLHFPLSTRLRTPHVTTLHGRLDLLELPFIYRLFPSMPLVSISYAQRRPVPNLNWRANIYHGLPERCGLPGHTKKDNSPKHLTFIGRISPEKRVDRAVEIAIKSRRQLVVAAKVDRVDREYFEREIAHLLDHPSISFVGEVGDYEKQELLRTSSALLFPIDWPEPFGLVMIEAMACGVPVIAFRAGSVAEIIEDGINGYVVDSVDEAVAAVEMAEQIPREQCRAVFHERFLASRMAAAYVEVYRRLMETDFSDPLLAA
jgi:glycosyltransferase involved in cell wall biosynthesis